jgi:Fe-S cluster biosynthesis and repair protein YggX
VKGLGLHWVFLGASLAFLSCRDVQEQETEPQEGTPIASAKAETLTLEEIPPYLFDNVSAQDSKRVLENFALQWMKRQALLEQAKNHLSEEEMDKSEEVQDYLNDLLIYEYQSKMMDRLLDTVIPEAAITDYYQANKENFELNENIVRLIFFKLPKRIKGRDQLWRDFQRNKSGILEKLSKLSAQNGGNFYVDDNNWLRFSDILKEIPIVAYNQELFLKNNKWLRLSDEEYDYFVNIIEFRIKNSISPLEFEKDRIRQILINRKKLQLMDSLENKAVQEALDKGKVKLLIK